jgi:hypothetical protein
VVLSGTPSQGRIQGDGRRQRAQGLPRQPQGLGPGRRSITNLSRARTSDARANQRSMGSHSSRGPLPYAQRQTSTVFVRVPPAEWAAVKIGVKREFRAGCGKHSALWNVQTPTPAVAYTVSRISGHRSALMVLEDVWREPLGAISPESLAAEGFESIAEFRRHWIAREHRSFPPLRVTTVYRVRPWTAADNREMADALLRRLYADFLPPAQR